MDGLFAANPCNPIENSGKIFLNGGKNRVGLKNYGTFVFPELSYRIISTNYNWLLDL